MHFAVACGGTGGHIFPGQATAQALRDRGHRVTLWLGGSKIGASAGATWPGPVITLPASDAAAGLLRGPLAFAAAAWRGFRTAHARMRTDPPAALLAMGSYASVGAALAARVLGVPIVLHEANVVPGRAVAVLARLAWAVAMSFPETRDRLRHRRQAVTGLPLRAELVAAATEPRPAPPVPTILVMGGSQGAQRLNAAATPALGRLRAEGFPVRVLHLAGAEGADAARAAYQAAGIAHEVHAFLADMPSAYRQATLAVSRSGAGSCAELTLFGIPSVLVPYPEAVRNHQLANARALAAAGAAEILEQRHLTPDALGAILGRWLGDAPRVARMAEAARARAVPDAADRLADLVEHAATGRGCFNGH
jgi:UDP-N-acetylglucosamine--N-acetylmuramyl-(pentapeptide) pyrophosphoryl-undecaprenol N-acetylglucosamine transferase